jgi:hypothetical protein
MDDAAEERFRQHESLMARLAVLLDAQHTTNQHQAAINERLTVAIERLDTTQGRIETLLARMIRQDGNGTDA